MCQTVRRTSTPELDKCLLLLLLPLLLLLLQVLMFPFCPMPIVFFAEVAAKVAHEQQQLQQQQKQTGNEPLDMDN
jgi:hypothetical protein